MGGAKEARPGFSFLVCPDSALLLQNLDRELERFPPSSGTWGRAIFWGDEPASTRFWESLKQQGLFTENRAVIVRRAQEWPAQTWKSLDEALGSGSSSIWPIFCLECEQEKGRFKIPAYIQKSRCYNHAEKKRWIWTSPPLSGKALRKYVEIEAGKRKLNFTSDALNSFCAAISPDASAICNELDKLSLVYGEEQLESHMLGLENSFTEANAFQCLRDLYEGKSVNVWREMARASSNSLLFFLIALLARDFHVFWQIQAGEKPYLHPSGAAVKQALARRLGAKGISQAFVLLANAEFQVKSGALSPEQAQDQLLADLQALFSGRG